MVQVIEITKDKFMDLYAKEMLYEITDVHMPDGTIRKYGKTTEGQADNPHTYIVVYAVM